MNPFSQFASFFQGGGPFMYIILGIGVLGFALALERFWTIARASSWNGNKITNDLTERVRKGDLQGAATIAKKVNSPIGQVAHAIVTSGARTEESLLNVADGEAAVALAPLSRRLPHIGLLANTATLLGLLGTIFGLTTAFAAVGAADPSQRSAFLAAGISQALNTTAFGLIIAIPGLLVHGFLAGRLERIGEQVDEVSVKMVRAMLQASGARPMTSSTSTPNPAVSHGAPTAPSRPQPVR
jgi:biopolymer transport protein ExbB/TolQ